ncbi:MAG: tRNA (N(6)-L-threonylcarbamoyladenosine(37)-C(2))-methylthiotransferase MtaB [Eubacteriales bacterium]|nr:tRNA (N(6)-L-threonylcarbamoyladenosine(37)-C(2))-methylthiotransferase MtaB [Eubacteriales bacterium]
MKSVAFCTLGCKVNQYETEAMLEMFKNSGYAEVDFDDFADVYVINTCTVTSISDRKSRQMIRRAKRLNPDSFIVVCGCYAQTAPNEVQGIDGVDLVIGTNEHINIIDYIEKRKKGIIVKDISKTHEFEQLSINNHSGKSRAYVKIQEGCNQFCTYCIIPYARGPIRSRDVNDIIEESERLVSVGFTEIVYVGIHVASYVLDTKECDLADLLIKLNKIEGIKRIRLSSIEPMTLNEDFCEKIKCCDKLCPHFHISLQSGCDATLARMNRRYTTTEYAKITNGLRRYFPNCGITTDIMVGFPGETDEEFSETLEFVKKINFADAHIFKYSRRKGTPADKMKNQISPDIKDLRSKELFEITSASQRNFLEKQLNIATEVLFETRVGEYMEGKTANYCTVYLKTNEDLTGKYRCVIPTEIKNSVLYAKLS